MLKKSLIALILIISVAALTACGESKQEETTPETTTAAPEIELPEGIVEPDEWLADAKSVVVSADGDILTLRQGPDSTYDAIDGIPDGSEISIEAEQDGWGFTNYSDQYGWVSMDFVTEE